MKPVNHRKIVVKTLADLIHTQAPLPLGFSQWPSISKHLLLETCRYYFKLKCIAQKMLPKPPKDGLVWSAILVGLCELHILKKPAHASIHELVQIIKQSSHQSASGLVNAVLRRFTREKDAILNLVKDNPEYIYSHPLWFIEHIQKSWPTYWQQILHANNHHAPMTLRVNLKLLSREEFLKNAHLEASCGKYSKASVILNSPLNVEDIYGFKDGLCSVQDEAAQLAALLLDLKPGLQVLDACAAPGGKTAHILECEPALKTCMAIESQIDRFEKLKQTMERLKMNAQCVHADATHTSWWDGKLFDRILIDAPCSGTGVIRRHPDIKLRRTPAQIFINTPIQAKLLTTLWPMLASNGLLVYATCSILPEENDEQIRQFLANTPDAQSIKPAIIAGYETDYGQQIFPGEHQMDGFYYAVLSKKALL